MKNILVKGIVSKAAMKGMSENITIFMPIVKREASKNRKRSDSKEKIEPVSTLKRGGTIRRPSSKNFDDEASQKEPLDASGWYTYLESMLETAKDLLDSLPWAAKVAAAVILVLWIIYSWLRAGSRHAKWNVENVNASSQQQPFVASRAVYLRDIDEGLLNADLKPVYGNSET